MRPGAILPLFLLILAGCEMKSQYCPVRLSKVEPIARFRPGVSEKTPFRLAVAPVLSPQATVRYYSELLAYLAAELHRPPELVQRRTYAEINDLMGCGDCDVAFVCGLAYLEGQRDFGMELLVIPEVQGRSVYHSYLIVPADSKARKLMDLRGKMFAFSDPLSNSGWLVPTFLLAQRGERPETFFQKTWFTYSHDNSIKAVGEKLVDGAAVDSLVYDYLVLHGSPDTDRTKVIEKSPPCAIPPVVVHPRLDPRQKKQFRHLFLTLDQNEEGRKVLHHLMIDRFVPPDDRLYDPMRQMWNQVRERP